MNQEHIQWLSVYLGREGGDCVGLGMTASQQSELLTDRQTDEQKEREALVPNNTLRPRSPLIVYVNLRPTSQPQTCTPAITHTTDMRRHPLMTYLTTMIDLGLVSLSDSH